MKNYETKLMIINNFIDWFTSDEEQREIIKNEAENYVNEDHVNEIEQSKPLPEFLSKMDWKLLREQKQYLLDTGIETEPMEGIINLIDSIQDYAVDGLGLSEKKVFNLK